MLPSFLFTHGMSEAGLLHPAYFSIYALQWGAANGVVLNQSYSALLSASSLKLHTTTVFPWGTTTE